MLQRLDDDGRDARLRDGVVRARAARRPCVDPFCGTGGNLLAACHMSRRPGIGADADARTLLRGTARCDGGSLKLDARLRKAQNMANVGGRREKKRGEPSLPSDASIRRNFLDRGLDPRLAYRLRRRGVGRPPG